MTRSKPTPETRAKISASMKRRLSDPTTRASHFATKKGRAKVDWNDPQSVGDYRRRYAREYERDFRRRALAKLGGRCANPACQWLNADGSRGCTDERCLQIDHVKGGGNKERLSGVGHGWTFYRRVLADTEGLYQALCANCNWIKRHVLQELSKVAR